MNKKRELIFITVWLAGVIGLVLVVLQLRQICPCWWLP